MTNLLDETQVDASQADSKSQQLDSELEGQLDIIAEWSITAPDPIKNVLFTFDPKQTRGRESSFGAFKKDEITATLEYLGIKKQWKDYLAPACVRLLVSRITNLMPTVCNSCSEKYTIVITDASLLPCKSCGKEPHRSCLARQLATDEESLTKDSVYNLINPFHRQDIHYICPTCSDQFIPSSTTGMTKKAAKLAETQIFETLVDSPLTTTVEIGFQISDSSCLLQENLETIHCSQVASSSKIDQPSKADQLSKAKSTEAKYSKANTEVTDKGKSKMKKLTPPGNTNRQKDAPPENPDHQKKKALCKYFRMGTCTHGISGKRDGECKFDHPKLCPKLMRDGTHKKHGCTLGKKCDFFHPKICSTSLTKRYCYDMECSDWHIKSTVRIRPDKGVMKSLTQQTSSDESNSSVIPSKNQTANEKNDQHFLDLAHCLETKLMKAVDEKLANIAQMIMNLQQQPMIQRYPMQPVIQPTQTNVPQQIQSTQAAQIVNPVHQVQYFPTPNQQISATPTFMV